MLRLCGRPRAQALRGAGVKLLLDENLSDRIISRVADLFPDSTHIKAVGLREADDFVVWEWAKKHGFTIVSKDTDFHQRAIVFGHPPKIIWLRVGNCETSLITNLLRSRYQVIWQFVESETRVHSFSNNRRPEQTTAAPSRPVLENQTSGLFKKSSISSTGTQRPLWAISEWIGQHRQSTSRVGKGRAGERYFGRCYFRLEHVG